MGRLRPLPQRRIHRAKRTQDGSNECWVIYVRGNPDDLALTARTNRVFDRLEERPVRCRVVKRLAGGIEE
jgi:hypothetical protein